VRDNGPGLQGRTIDMLCTTFYSTKRDGMGLGLGICRTIVESHGGSLVAEEAPGGGAQFRFTLPLVDAPNIRETT
jgi:signal transduction histidine kinase